MWNWSVLLLSSSELLLRAERFVALDLGEVEGQSMPITITDEAQASMMWKKRSYRHRECLSLTEEEMY